MKQNIFAIAVNLSRAWEIAQTGDHSIEIKVSGESEGRELERDQANVKFLKHAYGIKDTDNPDILITLHSVGYADIKASFDSKRAETREDIEKRINEAKGSKIVPELILTGPVDSLLKTATEKLSLSIRQINSICAVSKTIALLSNSEKVKIEHIAEAIQYQSA